jgi:hypothetical protein
VNDNSLREGRQVIAMHNIQKGGLGKAEFKDGHTYIIKDVIDVHTFLFTSLIPAFGSVRLNKDVVLDEDEFCALLNLLERDGYIKRLK